MVQLLVAQLQRMITFRSTLFVLSKEKRLPRSSSSCSLSSSESLGLVEEDAAERLAGSEGRKSESKEPKKKKKVKKSSFPVRLVCFVGGGSGSSKESNSPHPPSALRFPAATEESEVSTTSVGLF